MKHCLPAKNYLTLRGLILQRRWHWLLAFLLVFLTLVSVIGLLSSSGWFISAAAIAGILTTEISYVALSALIRLFAMTRTAARYGGDLVGHNAAFHLLKDLRTGVYHYLAQYRTKIHNARMNSVTIMHRLVVDIDRLDLFPLKFILPWAAASVITFLFGALVYWLVPGLLPYLLPGLIVSWLIAPLMSFIKGIRLAKEEVIIAEKCKEQFVEAISLLTPLLIWKTWDRAEARLSQTNGERLARQAGEQKETSLIALLQNLGLALCLAGCFYQGLPLIYTGQLSVPLFLAIILTVIGLAEVFLPLSGSFVSLGLSLFSKDRINALIAANEEFTFTPKAAPAAVETLELFRVSAHMPHALNGPVNVSFKLKKGEALCIRGLSGCGKTTLLDLLAGEITADAGTILLNNEPIENWDLSHTLGYLPQNIDIFDLSLRENLKIGKDDATDAELWAVLEKVNLARWAQLREGLETPLGEFGAEISGGEARRVALARLLLANRPLLLLDEPFAGLDQNNIAALWDYLQGYAADKILVIVSHHDLGRLGCPEYWLKPEFEPETRDVALG